MRSVTAERTSPQPVSLSEAKDQLGYAQADTTSDTRISRLIVAATEQFEHDTQQATTLKTITEKLPMFPLPTWRAYTRPIDSVDSITYFDSNNDVQTLDPSEYSVDLPNRKIYSAVGFDFPSTYVRWDAVTISYTAGQSIPVEISKQAILMQVDIMEELRGTTKEKDAATRAYENLVIRYMRGSYP
jgi:hypothetical protein